MEQNREKTVASFQWLRLFAALAVVLMHVAAEHWAAIPHDTPQWEVLTRWDSLVRWPVPVFLMITGAIFLPRKTEMKTMLTRYIPRMVLAFLLWSWIYARYSLDLGATEQEALEKFFSGEYHLWYLPFLCGIYLVLPFVQRIVTDRRLENQLLAASLVIGLVLPWMADLTAALWPEQGTLIRALENHLNYTFFFDLLAMLLLGHWLFRQELSRWQRWGIYALGLAGVLLTGPATIWISRLTGFQSALFFGHDSPTTICAAAAIFVFARYHLTRLPKAVDFLARQSFGVYLVHVLVLRMLSESGYHALAWDPVWSVPVLAAAVFAISMAVTALLSRIPVLGKYLI